MKKHLSLISIVLVVALLAFTVGYLAGQRPVAGTAQISFMSVPDPVIPSAGRSDRINVNSAGAAELTDIPGIGPAMAGRILDYREENGPFSVPEDLLNVRGIGEKTLDKMREYITFGGIDEDTGG